MIGANTTILPDVRIGNDVVIAAGSIVTRDIPDNTVAGGIPAKPLGSFEALARKRRELKVGLRDGADKIWADFEAKRK